MASEKTINKYGTQRWRNKEGICHREDGPAIIWPNGSQFWYQNGVKHRIGGPAIIWADGDLEWWQNGDRHRIDGPAIIRANGHEKWYLNGDRVEPISTKMNWKRYGF